MTQEPCLYYWMVTTCTSGMRDSRAAIKRFTWHLHGFSPVANGAAGGTTVATTVTPVGAWVRCTITTRQGAWHRDNLQRPLPASYHPRRLAGLNPPRQGDAWFRHTRLLPPVPLHPGLLPLGWRALGSPAPNDDASPCLGSNRDERLVFPLYRRVGNLENIEHAHGNMV